MSSLSFFPLRFCRVAKWTSALLSPVDASSRIGAVSSVRVRILGSSLWAKQAKLGTSGHLTTARGGLTAHCHKTFQRGPNSGLWGKPCTQVVFFVSTLCSTSLSCIQCCLALPGTSGIQFIVGSHAGSVVLHVRVPQRSAGQFATTVDLQQPSTVACPIAKGPRFIRHALLTWKLGNGGRIRGL